MIDAHEALVVVQLHIARADEIHAAQRVAVNALRRRPERHNALGDGRDAGIRNDVAGERSTRGRVDDLDARQRLAAGIRAVEQGAEVAGAESGRRHVGGSHPARLPALAGLVIEHEEGFVVPVVDFGNPHGTAEDASVLVLPQFVLGTARRTRGVEVVLEVVLRVQHIIAEELEPGAVELVGAGLQRDGELRACIGPVFGGVTAGLHLELLHGFDGRGEGHRIDAGLGDTYTVESSVLIGIPLAVGRNGDGRAGDRHAASASGQPVEAHAVAELHAGLQDRQTAQVAAVQGKLDDAALIHHLPQRGFVGVQQGRFRADLHPFALRTDLHAEVNARLLVQLQCDALARFRLEARHFDGDLIFTRVEQREVVVAGVGCQFRPLHTSAGVGDAYFGPGNDGGGSVADGSQD